MSEPKANRSFLTTRWTLIFQSRETQPFEENPALEALCRLYWQPAYGFCRSTGLSPADAEDATQAFFVKFLQRTGFSGADPARGRFRSFLLACLKNHLADLRDHQQSQRRGGGQVIQSLDAINGFPSNESARHPADSPDEAFDREWARTTMARALDRLREECSSSGRGTLFLMLNGESLAPDQRVWSYGEVAEQLGMKPDAVKYQAKLFKQRLRELLREEISPTVESPTEIQDELVHLLGLLH